MPLPTPRLRAGRDCGLQIQLELILFNLRQPPTPRLRGSRGFEQVNPPTPRLRAGKPSCGKEFSLRRAGNAHLNYL